MHSTGLALIAQRGFALLGRGVGQLACFIASALIVVMSAILFLQVTFRYGLKLPLPWSEEAARFCLVWFAMLAACVAGREGLHFAIRWGVNLLGPRSREAARIFVLLSGGCVLSFVAVEGFSYLSVVSGLTATATRINLAWIYAAIPVGCLGLALIHLAELADALLAPFTGQYLGVWRHTDERTFAQLVVGND